jgi:hypothetical protein
MVMERDLLLAKSREDYSLAAADVTPPKRWA